MNSVAALSGEQPDWPSWPNAALPG